MDWTERLTSAGRGRWGEHAADFALSTVRRTWHARRGDASQAIDRYRFSYQLLGPVRTGHEFREFDTSGERDAFFARSISDWAPRPKSSTVLRGCEPRFASWNGEILT